MATQISLHTLVSFLMKPRRSRAVPRLGLQGEQGADGSRELTCNVVCVYPCFFLVRAGLYRHSWSIQSWLVYIGMVNWFTYTYTWLVYTDMASLYRHG